MALALHVLFRGPTRLDEPQSGMQTERYTEVLHVSITSLEGRPNTSNPVHDTMVQSPGGSVYVPLAWQTMLEAPENEYPVSHEISTTCSNTADVRVVTRPGWTGMPGQGTRTQDG